MKVRSGLLTVIGGIAAVFALYTGYWFYACTIIDREVALWIEEQEAAGYEIEHDGLHIRGYPYRFSVSAVNPRVRAPQSDGGWYARLESVRANALPYDFSHWILHFSGPLLVEGNPPAASTLEINAERASISLVSDSNGQTTRIGAELENLVVDALSGPAPDIRSIESLQLSGVVDPQDMLRMRVEAHGLEAGPDTLAPNVMRAFGPVASIARFDITVTRWASLAREGDAAAWSRAGGELQIAEGELEWGPAHVTGTGGFTLDRMARPDGRLSLNITDPDALVDALVESDLISEEAAEPLRLGAIMAPRSSNGVPLPLRVRDGGVYFGPARIGEIGD